jgi:RimJ/RimL family protein N-acetyltransferase
MDFSTLRRFPRHPLSPLSNAPFNALGIALVPASAEDIPFLRELYIASRLLELLAAPWGLEQKRTFLDSQFVLQHNHFLRSHRKGDYHVINLADRPVGRLYFDRTGEDWSVIDVVLARSVQGRGIGTALIRWMQHSVDAAGATRLRLCVAHQNPRARKLYDRLGFLETAVSTTHSEMAWNGSRVDSGISR